MRATVLLITAVLLTGCASSGPIGGPGGDAEYRHPTTGDIQHCDNRIAAGALLFGVIGGVSAGNSYADCKTALEQRGYVRTRNGQMPTPALQPVEGRPAQSMAPSVTPAPTQPAPPMIVPASRGPQFGVVELHTGQRLQGRIKEITETTVSLEIEGQPISFPRDKVRGVYFDVAPR